LIAYHFLDDSGDPGLTGAAGSSSHLVLAMVELPDNEALPQLASLRQLFRFPSSFEFKYHNTTAVHKDAFFQAIRTIPCSIRAVIVEKSHLPQEFASLKGSNLVIELTCQLILRDTHSSISDDVLIIDAATSAFCQALRVRLSTEYRNLQRVRPFKKITSGQSHKEDGLQLADMIAGAIRHHAMKVTSDYYKTFKSKVADIWYIGK